MTLQLSREEIFHQLAEGLVSDGASDFFPELAGRLASLLEMDHVLIGEVQPDGATVQTLAVWSRGAVADNFAYELAGSPCSRVVFRELCIFRGDLASQFPADEMLVAMQPRSYVGIPLTARDGTHIGVLALLSDTDVELPAFAFEVLRIAAVQAGAELARQLIEQAVQESERRLHTLMNHLPGMAYQCRYDACWTMLFVSQGVVALTGYPVEELVGDGAIAFSDLMHPADRPRVNDEVADAISRHQLYRLTYRLRNAQGVWRWLWEQGQAVFDADGNVLWLEGFITDITEQQHAHRAQQAVAQVAMAATTGAGTDFFLRLVTHLTAALGATAGVLATIAWRGRDPIFDTHAVVAQGAVLPNLELPLSATPFAELLSEGECAFQIAPGSPLATLLDSADRPGRRGDQALSGIGRRLDNADGEAVGILVVCFDEALDEVDFPRSVLRIIAAEAVAEFERHKHQQRVQRLAYSDSTTGLLNRAGFMESLDATLRAARTDGTPLGLLICDLRRFKEVNDTHGHAIGDLLLAAVAARLAGTVSPPQCLARLASDEFALLLPDATVADLEAASRAMSAALRQPVRVDDHEFTVELSIGAAQFPGDTTDPDELFQHASIALYHAKSSSDPLGRRFDVGMFSALHRRQQMTERFTRALQLGELLLHYQPQFDLRSGQLTGAEALCRWHDPEWGWVSPAEFIPLVEERGLMNRLGEWVLATGCQQLRTWHAAGLPIPARLAINVSAQQFDNAQLASLIADLASGLPDGCITLELTESSLMRDPAQAVAATQALKSAGFGISIDDFGTGYSSLSYLKRFAADTLKIDKSFVQDMLGDVHDLAIVTTIIAMARGLGMRTVAEGVETAEQARRLAELGCEQVQGYFFGRPVPAAEFAEIWLRPTDQRHQCG